jgi:Mg2+ and Co2+ transporter CorA
MQKIRYTAPGSAPATLVTLAEQAGCKPRLQLIEYDAHFSRSGRSNGRTSVSLHSSRVNWINVGGLGDVETLRKLGEHFRVHPLAFEDVFNTGQRPHLDEYEDQLFIVLQAFRLSGCSGHHVSYSHRHDRVLQTQELVLRRTRTKNSHRERRDSKERIRNEESRILNLGAREINREWTLMNANKQNHIHIRSR